MQKVRKITFTKLLGLVCFALGCELRPLSQSGLDVIVTDAERAEKTSYSVFETDILEPGYHYCLYSREIPKEVFDSLVSDNRIEFSELAQTYGRMRYADGSGESSGAFYAIPSDLFVELIPRAVRLALQAEKAEIEGSLSGRKYELEVVNKRIDEVTQEIRDATAPPQRGKLEPYDPDEIERQRFERSRLQYLRKKALQKEEKEKSSLKQKARLLAQRFHIPLPILAAQGSPELADLEKKIEEVEANLEDLAKQEGLWRAWKEFREEDQERRRQITFLEGQAQKVLEQYKVLTLRANAYRDFVQQKPLESEALVKLSSVGEYAQRSRVTRVHNTFGRAYSLAVKMYRDACLGFPRFEKENISDIRCDRRFRCMEPQERERLLRGIYREQKSKRR